MEQAAEKSLDKFVPGEIGLVYKVLGEGVLKRRLFDMGITPGTRVCLRKNAPLGDPLELRLRGYELSIRKSEAASILMKMEGGSACALCSCRKPQ